jgi:glutamyl/glutaminyl-tRNA synthetase
LNKIKKIAEELGYAPEVKLFKENPDKYPGHFGDITQIYRIILSGRPQSPDLYEIMRVLGEEKTRQRLEAFLKK